MASFDIITAAGHSYILLWNERSYLMKLALIPVLIKLTSLTLAVAFGAHEDIIHLSLFLLPSFLVEGWMLSHIVRLIFLNQKWPFQPSGNDKEDKKLIEDRAKGIMGGIASFALINMVAGACFALILHYSVDPNNPDQISREFAFLSLFLLVFSIWAFRLFWLYIPLAVNYPVSKFLKNIGGYKISFYLIGVWLLCFVPPMLAMQFFSGFFVFNETDDIFLSLQNFLDIIVRVVFDTCKNILCTAGVAYGIHDFFKRLEE